MNSLRQQDPIPDPYANTHIGLEPETVVLFCVLGLLALFTDMWVHRRDSAVTFRSALGWSVFWVLVSMGFAVYLTLHFNTDVASLYLAGYIFELSLSVDNLFVIMAIFAWFKVPSHLQHRVLFWGVLGAIVFRLLFVVIGSGLFALGPWVELVFAALVAGSGIMMLKKKDDDQDADFSNNLTYRAVRYLFPVFPRIVGHSFFLSQSQVKAELSREENKGLDLKRTGAWFATPLFLCLAVIETSDILFAFDSVPAVIAVSREPLIVYSAMMFAVLGLRSMYFVLDVMSKYLIHLEKAVIFLLFFIALKLCASASLHLFGFGFDIDIYTSLTVIAVILGVGIAASFIFPGKKDEKDA